MPTGDWMNVIQLNLPYVGWRYGFVSMNRDGSWTYSETFSDPIGIASFIVPENASRLFFVVQGSRDRYLQQSWDDNELTDDQFPYKLKFTNTGLRL